MTAKSCITGVVAIFIVCASASLLHAQSGNADLASPVAPKYLSMVHQEIKPGRTGAYDELEGSIARIYSRESIPVFWVTLESITGPPEVLCLSLFESSEEMSKSKEALNTALAAHPELAQMQDRLLQDNTSNGTTVLAVRRDDMGYRTNAIDFAKMRFLRLSTVFAHPGYERAFMETQWALSEASQKAHAQAAWAVYEVLGGLPEPAFVIVTPMASLQEIDDIFQTSESLKKSEGGAIQQHLQELARIAYGTSDTRLFSVGPRMSHVSKNFAAGDAEFWNPAAVSASPASAARGDKPAPKSIGAPTSKP